MNIWMFPKIGVPPNHPFLPYKYLLHKVYMGLIIKGPPSQGFSHRFPMIVSPRRLVTQPTRLLDGCLAIGSDGGSGGVTHDLSVAAISRGSPAAKVRSRVYQRVSRWWFQTFFIFTPTYLKMMLSKRSFLF